MRKFLVSISFLFFFTAVAFAQKLNIHVVRFQEVEWQILDTEMNLVFPGSQVFREDSVIFSLETNKRYHLSISVNNDIIAGKNLILLYIDDEPVVLVNSDLAAGDHLLPFFTGVKRPESKITGGTNAELSEFPWQVYIAAGTSACGGSVIGPNWILTAAHCVTDDDGILIDEDDIFVTAGSENPFIPDPADIYRAADVIIHEQFNNENLENDIALIRLERAVTDATPVKIVTEEDERWGVTDPGVMTWVTGWGITSTTSQDFPDQLQKVQLPIVTLAQAATVWNDIPPTVIMAGYRNGTMDACSGDSGGPMVVEVLGEYRQAGIVSWGSRNCNTYGAYTRVSLFDDWIYEKTGFIAPVTPAGISGGTIICNNQNTSEYTTSFVTGTQSYEWKLYPESAGTTTGSLLSVSIAWSDGFNGIAELGYRAITNGTLSEWSRIRINVVEQTRFLTIPEDQVTCENRRVIFNVESEGYQTIYTWYRNGEILRTDSQPDLIIFPARPEHSGIYRLDAEGFCNDVSTGDIALTVHPLTEIVNISPDMSVPFGSGTTMEVFADGHQLTYQWIKDGTPIDGQTGSSLQLSDVDATDIGNYRVTVSGTCGTVTSDSVYLFVANTGQAGGSNVYVWPTITGGIINIATENAETYDVYIIDTSGKVHYIKRKLRYENTIDISNLPKGLYIVSIQSMSFKKAVRIVKY